MKTRKYILIIIVFILGCANLEDHLANLAKTNVVESEYVGFAGSESDQYKRFQKIKKRGDTEFFLQMLEHDSTAVKCYGVYALLDTKQKPAFELFDMFYNKNYNVKTFYGCMYGVYALDFMIYDHYRDKLISYPETFENFSHTMISDARDLFRMDSLIITKSNPETLLYKSSLNSRIYNGMLLEKIKKSAIVNQHLESLIYLASNHLDELEKEISSVIDDLLASEGSYNVQMEKLKEIRMKLKDDNTR